MSHSNLYKNYSLYTNLDSCVSTNADVSLTFAGDRAKIDRSAERFPAKDGVSCCAFSASGFAQQEKADHVLFNRMALSFMFHIALNLIDNP